MRGVPPFSSALVLIVALPGLLVLGETYLAAQRVVPLAPFLAGVRVSLPALIFYLSLVILLGVQFESRGPVLGIAFGVMFSGTMFVQFFPQFTFALPFGMDKIATLVGLGMPLSRVKENSGSDIRDVRTGALQSKGPRVRVAPGAPIYGGKPKKNSHIWRYGSFLFKLVDRQWTNWRTCILSFEL